MVADTQQSSAHAAHFNSAVYTKRRPGEIHWAIWRRNLDGSEPRYYLSNAPEDTPLETLARVAH